MTRVLIADDHGVVRGGLRVLLDRQPDVEVVAEAADGLEAVAAAVEHRPDVAVLDVTMPGMTGLEATRELARRAPEVRVLVLSMHDDEHLVAEALQAGARGYVVKHQAGTELVDAVRAVARGEVRSPAFDDHGAVQPLSPREREVVVLIADGHRNRDIADLLGMAEKTVESHRGNILRKLGMRDRVELVRYAIRRGLIAA
jgi:DNA-binding NarL/FixJ family response regulator